MNSPQFDEFEASLRHAVARGAYTEAQDYLTGLREAVDRAIRDHADSGEIEQLVGRANDLLRWALQVTRASRAGRRFELSGLNSVSRYHQTSGRAPRLRVQA